MRRCSEPLAIQFVALSQVAGFFKRERDPLQSTDHAFARFLVPSMCDFEGWALFVDGDMLFLEDVAKLWELRDGRRAVMVVQRDQHPQDAGTKFYGRAQTSYPRKNWSSVMLLNTTVCRRLMPAYVETAKGLDLHQFKWVVDDTDIGALPAQWNHLVGVDAPRPDAAIVHYTLGMPYVEGKEFCEYAAEWREEYRHMITDAGAQHA